MLTRRNEQGSVAAAMAIIMIVSTIAIGGITRTMGTLKAARANQDFNANLTNADSALSDVMFRLDQGTTGTLDSAPTETRFRYHATPTSVDSYDVKAVGTANGRPHAIEATLTRRRSFAYAIYARHDLDLSSGNTPAICGTVDPVSGYYPALIGASGKITLRSGAPGPLPTPTSATARCQLARGGDGQDTFAPAGVCMACYSTSYYRSPDAQFLSASQAPTLTDITAAPHGATAQCGFSGYVAAGAYLCSGNLTFTGDVTVPQTGPPVLLYELNGGTLQIDKHSLNYPTTPLATPSLTTLAASPSGGTIPAGTSYFRVTATLSTGETLASAEKSVTTTGSSSSITVSWGAATGATGYNLYYSRTPGAELNLVSLADVTSYVQTGVGTPAGALPTTNTTLTAQPGNSGQLQIYKGGVGTIDIGSGGSAQVSSVIQAPYSTLTANGQGLHYAGALVLDTFIYNGQPDFTFRYNQGAALITRDWTG